MATLYEIKGAMSNLAEMLDTVEFDEETQRNLEEAYQQIEGDFTQKVEDTVKMIRNFESDADALDAEIKRLTAKKKAAQSRAEWLRSNIKSAMQAVGKDKVKTPFCSVTLGEEKLRAYTFS